MKYIECPARNLTKRASVPELRERHCFCFFTKMCMAIMPISIGIPFILPYTYRGGLWGREKFLSRRQTLSLSSSWFCLETANLSNGRACFGQSFLASL